MSKISDFFEKYIESSVNNIKGWKASRPTSSVHYSDLFVSKGKLNSWIEVKMDNKANMSNPRVSYIDGRWESSSNSFVALEGTRYLNSSYLTKKFIKEISEYTQINYQNIIISSKRSMLKHNHSVPLNLMTNYFINKKTKYILKQENVDMGYLITQHYLYGKKEPAHYLQSGDDFYRIGAVNPLNLPDDIPKVTGIGNLKVRVSTRKQFYEIMIEAKIENMQESPYSIAYGSKKLNPLVY